MGSIDWKFVFKRRNWTLENYLANCKTLEAAVLKFKKDGMIPPNNEVLSHHMESTSKQPQVVTESPEPLKKSFSKNRAKNKKSPQTKEENSNNEKGSEYDDIIVLEDKR